MGGGIGGTLGRIGGDVLTGGLAEFAQPNSFGIPQSIATPLKIGAGSIGGGLLGGPGGALAGGTLGGLLGGNVAGGAAGGGIAALLQSLLSGGGGGIGGGGASSLLGAGLLGSGLAMNPSVGNVGMPSNAADQAAIQSEEGRLQGMQKDSQNQLLQMLTSGPQGEAFREKYNNLGLLDSGALNQGLAEQFANQQYQQSQQLQNLDQSGLSRQFGLEDQGTQFNIAQAIANAQMKAQQQQALIGGGSYILGGGMGGGGGGAGGATPGAGGGSSISNLVQSLMGGIGTAGSSLGSLFGNLFGGNQPISTGQIQPNPIDPSQMSMNIDPTQMMSVQ